MPSPKCTTVPHSEVTGVRIENRGLNVPLNPQQKESHETTQWEGLIAVQQEHSAPRSLRDKVASMINRLVKLLCAAHTG